LDKGPPNSFATPVSASLIPSIKPSAPADERSVTVTKGGSTEVAISCPESLKKLARPMLPTPRVGQARGGGGARGAVATREVREETGVTAELREKLGEVQYTYERRGRRIAKRVAFFLFEYRSGDLADHDHEIEEARWMPLAEAAETLSYAGERSIVSRALSRIEQDR